jgi:hypothetical protein
MPSSVAISMTSENELIRIDSNSNNNEKESKIKKIKKRTYDLLEVSTCHGIPNIIRTKRLFSILMWSLFIIVSSITGTYFVIKNIVDYLNYNTITTINVIGESEAEFPTLSFCIPALNSKIEKSILKVNFNRMEETNLSQIFEEFDDNVFGKCFRFNSGKNIYNQSIPIFKSIKGGKPNDLKIVFYFEVPKDLDFIELLIFIHNHSSLPYDMDNGGYWIKPGSWNYYAIDRIYSNKLSEPYNDCLNDVNLFQMNKTLIDYMLGSNRMYTQNDCYYVCSHLFALEESKCGCNSSIHNFNYDCVRQSFDISENDVKICISKYLNDFSNQYEREKCSKYCPLECNSMSYRINNYFELFPSSGNISSISKEYYGLLNNFNTYEEVNKHLTVLYVYFNDLKYTFISEEPKTELFNVISNIGGILGLFLGISFLSFVELFEILFEIFITLILNK